jgi:hypothetical protein
MDKLLKLQGAIIDLLAYYAERFNGSNVKDVKHYVIKDTENHHYQLISMGFRNGVFIHNCIFHFDIINEKIWLQVNNTDILIADELIEKGILKKNIVLGFHEPHLRQYTGFAVA